MISVREIVTNWPVEAIYLISLVIIFTSVFFKIPSVILVYNWVCKQ